MWRENFADVIDPTCKRAHVLCQDGNDVTAAVFPPTSGARWGPSLPGGVDDRAESPRGNLTKVRRGDPSGPPRGRATPAAGAETNRET
jgi:hypothetical protein